MQEERQQTKDKTNIYNIYEVSAARIVFEMATDDLVRGIPIPGLCSWLAVGGALIADLIVGLAL